MLQEVYFGRHFCYIKRILETLSSENIFYAFNTLQEEKLEKRFMGSRKEIDTDKYKFCIR